MTGSDELALGIFAGVSMAMVFFALLLLVLVIIARWMIFSKAGEAGWKSIIPIYADYIQWKIGWNKTGLFWVYVLLLLAGGILWSIGGLTSSQIAGVEPVDMAAANAPLVVFGCLLAIAGGILALVAAYKLFRSFGHGGGMFIAYIFFPNIVLLVLGFGSSRYIGAQD